MIKPRSLHRFIGVALVLPLFVWTTTGLLFHLKPGWEGAYERLDAFRPDPLDAEAILPLTEFLQDGERPTALEIRATALGPLARISLEPQGTTRLVHAESGRVVSPLGEADALLLVEDATSRSRDPSRYGGISTATVQDEAVVFTFAGGVEVRVDRSNGGLSQRGSDTTWINRLYELHYLRWTGVPGFDRLLSVGAVVGVWGIVGFGLMLLRRRPRSE